MPKHKVVPYGDGSVECPICGTVWIIEDFENNVDVGNCEGPKGRHATDCMCPTHA